MDEALENMRDELNKTRKVGDMSSNDLKKRISKSEKDLSEK